MIRPLRNSAPTGAKGDEAANGLGMVYAMFVEPFLDRLGPGLDADIVDLIRALAPDVPKWIGSSDTPTTVIHLDYRPDNFMFGITPDAPPLVVVDWQTANEGSAMWDLAYMIGGGFQPAQRAEVERGLLDDYRSRLSSRRGGLRRRHAVARLPPRIAVGRGDDGDRHDPRRADRTR